MGSMPVFLTMTADLDQKHRHRTALKAVLVATLTLVFFMYTGKLLFNFFGISINSFRIVGGVIFFLMGMDMLQARLGTIKVKENEIKKYVNDISVYTPCHSYDLRTRSHY
jgi:multiple antibiotic resistance protein